jgi:2',3'-cyclic-nucleotide 2'-phosphodiesterase (5'-nucleotidase family)
MKIRPNAHKPAQTPKSNTVTLQLLHTNDMHGSLEPVKDRVILGHKTKLGGSAYLASVMKKAKQENRNTVVLDAGDSVSGQVASDLNHGRSMVEVMNRMPYSAATIGNHDFDFYVENLLDRLEMAEYPMVITNTTYEDGSSLPNTESSKIIETPDLKVGVLGLLTEEMSAVTLPEKRQGIKFEAPELALKREIPKLKAQGADVIVVMSHNGLEKDSQLAGDFPNEQLIILGGHSHDRITEPREVSGNYVFQAGSHGKELGQVEIEIDPAAKKIVGIDSDLLLVDPSKVQPDAEIKSIVSGYVAEAEKALGKVVGQTPQSLTRKYSTDSLLGNWVTDAMRDRLGTDIALMNSDGLRADLPDGDVTKGQVREVRPFDGMYLYKGEISGQSLKKVLEHSTSYRETEPGGRSSFLQASGLEFSYDNERPEGNRVYDVRVGDQPLSMKKNYSIACENYLASGQLGYEAMTEANYQETGLTTLEVLEEFASSYSPSNLSEGRRIHDMTHIS